MAVSRRALILIYEEHVQEHLREGLMMMLSKKVELRVMEVKDPRFQSTKGGKRNCEYMSPS